MVRGVFDKLITHLSLLVHVPLWLFGNPGAALEAGSGLVEGVGAMGVAGAAGSLKGRVEVPVKLDGTFRCPLHISLVSIHVRSNTLPNTHKQPQTTPPTAAPSW